MDGGSATLLVLGLLSTVDLGGGIRCYICSSSLDSRCLDPFTGDSSAPKSLTPEYTAPKSTAPMTPVECSDTHIIDHLISLLKPEEGSITKSACQKVVINFLDHKQIVRGCSPFKDSCDALMLVPGGENTLEYCGICEGDGCNLAVPWGSSLPVSATLPLAVVLASIEWRWW